MGLLISTGGRSSWQVFGEPERQTIRTRVTIARKSLSQRYRNGRRGILGPGGCRLHNDGTSLPGQGNRGVNEVRPARRPGAGAGAIRRLARTGPRRAVLGVLLAAVLAASSAAAGLSADEVRRALDRATPEHPADLAGKDLSKLDLSGLDFKRANLAHADLFGAKLIGAKLAGVDLRFARLDLAWIMRADFTGADLSHASLFGPIVAPGLDPPAPGDAPRFAGADFTGARVIARFAGFDLRGARFTDAKLGVDVRNQPMGQMRNDFTGADLSGAVLAGADLNRAVLAFAKLRGADLAGANLFRADLSRADLTGADLAGANLAEADLDGTVLAGVKHLDRAKGLDKALNADKAVR